MQAEEIVPTVPPVPGIDLSDYCAVVRQRFGNPKIEDTIRRLCCDGSNRQPKFIIPSIMDALQNGGRVTGLSLVKLIVIYFISRLSTKTL